MYSFMVRCNKSRTKNKEQTLFAARAQTSHFVRSGILGPRPGGPVVRRVSALVPHGDPSTSWSSSSKCKCDALLRLVSVCIGLYRFIPDPLVFFGRGADWPCPGLRISYCHFTERALHVLLSRLIAPALFHFIALHFGAAISTRVAAAVPDIHERVAWRIWCSTHRRR